MSDNRSFTDIMRPPEIDACKAPMRAAIWQMEAMGLKDPFLVGDLSIVLLELIYEDEQVWTNKFYYQLMRMGDQGVMTGRFASGWSGSARRDACNRAFSQQRAEAKPDPVPAKYEDSAYGNELDIRQQMMRGVVRQLQAEGFKGRHMFPALLEVLSETAALAGAQTLTDFVEKLRGWGRENDRDMAYLGGRPASPERISETH